MFKINRLEPINTLIDYSVTSTSTSTNIETLGVTSTERFIASKTLKSNVTISGDTTPARLNSEVIIELFKESLGFIIELSVIVPSPGIVVNYSCTEIEARRSTRTRKLVTIF